jgi:hypothetical protein
MEDWKEIIPFSTMDTTGLEELHEAVEHIIGGAGEENKIVPELGS